MRFQWVSEARSAREHENFLHKGDIVLLAVIKNPWYRQTVFALCVDSRHMQPWRNTRNAPWKWSNIWLCSGLRKILTGLRKSHTVDGVSPLKDPKTRALLWSRWSLPPDRCEKCLFVRPCACLCSCVCARACAHFLECVQYLHEVWRSCNWAALQSSDDTFKSSPYFPPPFPLLTAFSFLSFFFSKTALGPRRPHCSLTGDIFLHMWGSGRCFRRTGSHGEHDRRNDKGWVKAATEQTLRAAACGMLHKVRNATALGTEGTASIF